MVFLLTSGCDCEKDIEVGRFQLTEASTRFIPYEGTETLVFEDQDGQRYSLTSTEGRVAADRSLPVRELCSEGFFDNQSAVYRTQYEEVVFATANDEARITAQLRTQAENAERLEDIAVYDLLTVQVGTEGFGGTLNLLVMEKQNQVSAAQRAMLNLAHFVGDTTLYGREFPDVYRSESGSGKLFYNTQAGVLAIVRSDSAHWVLRP